MKILFIGDVVGSPGRSTLKEYLPKLKSKYRPDVTIVNAENAASGKGLTKKIYHELITAGADILTMGNHMWDKKEIFDFIDDVDNLARPVNFPANNPGKGYVTGTYNGKKIAVINAQGRTFMQPIDCPFETLDQLVDKLRQETKHIFIDFHAEATSEKLAISWFLDGRVTAVAGTHTHVPTADERILPEGTAHITDTGMTGPYDGIIGMDKDTIINRFRNGLPARFEVTDGRTQLNGLFIESDQQTGLAKSIKRIQISDDHPFFD